MRPRNPRIDRPEHEKLFKYLVITQIVLYLEAGAVPCVLDQLTELAHLSATQQGALGGVVYFALSIASPFCGYLLKHCNVKCIIASTLVANTCFTLAFALTPLNWNSSSTMLILFRALIGFTQAFVSIYAPLWVDEFAPKDKVTGWMSYLQGSVSVGVMLGYFLGVISSGFGTRMCFLFSCWRWPFLIQFLLTVPLVLGVLFVPFHHLNIHDQKMVRDIVTVTASGKKQRCSIIQHHHPKTLLEEDVELRSSSLLDPTEDYVPDLNLTQKSSVRASYVLPRVRWDSFNIDQISTDDDASFLDSIDYGSMDTPTEYVNLELSPTSTIVDLDEAAQSVESILQLVLLPTYILIVLGLTSIYFVVTGIQYWATIYMLKSMNVDRYLANAIFVFVAGTGPILGVFFGGWIIDQNGGYRGKVQRAHALEICFILGSIATALAYVTPFLTNIWLTAGSLWLVLFFGGAVLPACTGIFISVVPRVNRAPASSLSVMIFNLLGYALSPYLTGLVMSFVLAHTKGKDSYFADCGEACAYRIGFGFCLGWSVWSLIFIGLATVHARKEASKKRQRRRKRLLEEQNEAVGLLSNEAYHSKREAHESVRVSGE